jgi:hypothetical protein
MLRFFGFVLGSLGLAACAHQAPPIDREAAGQRASAAAFRIEPETEPIPLPPLRPATRRDSELAQLRHAELAHWTLPPDAARTIVSSTLLRGHMPRTSAILLYQAPVATPYPGLCAVDGYEILLSVHDEARLTYQEHLDPPMRPSHYRPFRRWKVVGSTIAAQRSAPPDCAAARPYSAWFDASSGAMLHRAAGAVEQAQKGLLKPQIHCQQMRYEEARQGFVHSACPSPRALLEKLTPELIKQARPADCEIAPSPTGCIGIEYHDPTAPGTHSLYVVSMPNSERPDYIRIVQAMLPPS